MQRPGKLHRRRLCRENGAKIIRPVMICVVVVLIVKLLLGNKAAASALYSISRNLS
ncbi:MAG: hypothetical protein ACLU8D_09670 [Enterocloster sp.]